MRPERDPRTDGVGDGGHTELASLSEEEIADALAYDRAHARQTEDEQ